MRLRRALYALVSVSVVTASVASSADAATKKKPKPKKPVTPACASFTDPSGDSYLQASPAKAPTDNTLDVTKVTYGVANGTLTIKLTVPAYAATQQASGGSEFDGGFSVGGHTVTLFANRGPAWTATSLAFAQQGIQIDGTYVQKTNAVVTSTVTGGVVTLTAALADIATAAGVPVSGATMSAFNFTAWGTYGALLEKFDIGQGGTTAKLVTCK